MRWRKEVEVDSGGVAAFIHWAWPGGVILNAPHRCAIIGGHVAILGAADWGQSALPPGRPFDGQLS